MKTAIDKLGRLVVPKSIRDRLGLLPGTVLDLEEHDGVIELRPQPAQVIVLETAEGPVAMPSSDTPPLTDEIVRETLEQIRR